MPELPEVETIRRGLEGPMLGRRIIAARLHRTDICAAAAGRRCRGRDLLRDAVVQRLERCGKQLAIVAEDARVLVVQLGMSGQLRVLGHGESRGALTHIHAEWELETGVRVVFRDPRRFGGLTALPSIGALRERWSVLGPDALTITGRELAAALRASRRSIKAGLLDQGAIAGVGNIYADEALFRARIRPDRLCTSLDGRAYSRLSAAIRRVLEVAICSGGSTLRDYTNAAGGRGEAQQGHLVYGRAGGACPRCGGVLEGTRLAQRATVFCPCCQW